MGMRTVLLIALGLPLASLAAHAEPLPPGLHSARLLPGWTDAGGERIAALELRLQPGWKTYWRSPGDSGLPPSFDWRGSQNLAGVEFHWPAPEAIPSGDEVSLGYHDLLVLPFTARPADPDMPLHLAASIDFGLCEKICVPAHVDLQAAAAGDTPDPHIQRALAQVPAVLPDRPACTISAISDGMRLTVDLPNANSDAAVVAMELGGHADVWVSSATLTRGTTGAQASADFVPPDGAPFDLDPERLRLTLVGQDGAVEMRGCVPQG